MAALQHEEPDRVPIDVGGPVSSMHIVAYDRLTSYLGLWVKGEVCDKIQQLAKPHEEILEKLGVDFRHVGLRKGFFMGGEDRVDDPSGRPYFIDDWGIKWGKGPYYYDMIDHPLKDATVEDLEDYPWPDPRDPARYEGLKDEARNLYETTDYAIVTDPIFGGPFECAWWLRGFENFMVDMYTRPDFAEALLDKIMELYTGFYGRFLDEVGRYVQVTQLGDDLGSQTGPLIPLSLFRRYLKPRHKRLFDLFHSKSRAKVFFHSCGSVYPFINDLIEIGLDILNPIQPLAAMMDVGRLKREFGDKLSFHGGIDIQRVLPYGSPDEVTEEVKRVLELAGPSGGYIIASSHNIQADTPPENILAMFKAAKQHGVYPGEG